MSTDARHLGVRISRPARDVYEFCAEPANLPRWAAGLGESVDRVGGRWVAHSPRGPVEVEFAPRNPFGVLDHRVTLADGTEIDNPLRVMPDGPASADVVFTLRRRDDVTAAEFEADAAAVLADLETLKALLERGDA